MMKLSQLLENIAPISETDDVIVTGLAIDSRLLKAGDIFIAKANAENFIVEAIEKNIRAILIDSKSTLPTHQFFLPIIRVPNLAHTMGTIAARFYQHPSKSMIIVGVTGTNGKTSCTQFIAQALTILKQKTGVIGTLGYGFLPNLIDTHFTTPDVVSNQALLSDLKTQQARCVAMEVSSHALAQGRVDEINFHTAIFTNLTHDHLDYHGTMQAYGDAKRLLFLNSHLQQVIINIDDEFGLQLAADRASVLKTYTYSLQEPTTHHHPDIYVKHIQTSNHGLSALIATPWGSGSLQTSLLGKFNLHNVLATLTFLCSLEYPLSEVLSALSQLQAVPGRMQRYAGENSPLVVIDYAHTPDALEKALQALRDHCSGKLICVFGCGGGRDTSKRNKMGAIAERYSDQVFITNDNPRHDDPQKIAFDILEGFTRPEAVQIILDRKKAIETAFQTAQQNDIILIAGKGHENYQQFGDTRFPFNDGNIVTEWLNTHLRG